MKLPQAIQRLTAAFIFCLFALALSGPALLVGCKTAPSIERAAHNSIKASDAAVEAVVSGLTASDPGPGEQRYTVPANFLNLDAQPDGVISYHVQIVKPCTIP